MSEDPTLARELPTARTETARTETRERQHTALSDLMSLTKPRLSTLVLFTAGGGLWLSDHPVTAATAVGAVLGTTLVVGGANALNCYIERDTDKYMARTKDRPLPAGRMKPSTALAFGLGLSAVSLPMLAWLGTPLAAALAAIALFSYVLVYTPLKRTSALSTLVGAVPGALPPLIGWTAATGSLDLGGIVLFSLLFLWQIPHSLAIGTYRKAEYRRAGLVVFPLEHGDAATRRQMVLYSLPMALVPLVLYRLGVAGPLTLVVGTTLGLTMVGLTLRGLVLELGARWARKVFFFTLAHLTLLFAVLSIDQLL